MNVDRMRRYSAGAREVAERRDRAAWVASHAHTGVACAFCLARALEPLDRMMARAKRPVR